MLRTRSSDPFGLGRFTAAQDADGTYERALAELRAGRKTSHWMWFVFPQIAGLGSSPTSRRYAISSLEEARSYLAHPVLGPRLLECTRLVADLGGRTARDVFGEIDAVKLRSSMTLFAIASSEEPVFGAVLDRFFGGSRDPATEERVAT
ncbi:MAG: hypothetical protein JWM71_2444 [Solirubrobacteraceae bacterium]|nr:hypothetical protein [Solirubrobacteraceae bacterium]